jgi:hypothetical protein
MKIIVGDEFGLIKCVDAEKKLISSRHGDMKKQNGVIGITNLFDNTNDTLAITHEQNFYILDWATKTTKSEPLEKLNDKTLYTSQIVKRTIDFSSVILSRNDNFINLIQYDDDVKVKSSTDFEIKTKKLEAIKDSHITQEFFCLFKQSPIAIYSLDTNDVIWKAKNLPNDEFDLQIPIYDIDVAHSKSNPNQFYTATAFGEIRSYDRKVKPRPVHDKKIFDRKINRMVMSNCENYLTIGDTLGNIFMLDKRKSKLLFYYLFRSGNC